MSRRIEVFDVDGRWSVAENGVWVPGLYDSAKTARRAAREFSDVELQPLDHVWRFDGLDRPATMADLDGLVSSDD